MNLHIQMTRRVKLIYLQESVTIFTDSDYGMTRNKITILFDILICSTLCAQDLKLLI